MVLSNLRIDRTLALTSRALTNAGKSTLRQTLYVHVVSEIQNVQSSDWPK